MRYFVQYGVLGLAVVLFGTGCGTAPVKPEPLIPPKRPAGEIVREDVDYPIEVYDPWEPMNRRIYLFNARFDEFVFLPVVRAYAWITPDFVERGVSNFYDNVGEVSNLTNNLLQFKFKRFFKTAGRVLLNTTFGLLGLIDVATDIGIQRQNEDFGQTLGFYGFGAGPYLVLPFAGPSNLRDAAGLALDSLVFYYLDPFNFENNDAYYYYYPYLALYAVDARHKMSFRYYRTGSPFEYELIRLLYHEGRLLMIQK